MKKLSLAILVLGILTVSCSSKKDISYDDAFDGHPGEKEAAKMKELSDDDLEDDLFLEDDTIEEVAGKSAKNVEDDLDTLFDDNLLDITDAPGNIVVDDAPAEEVVVAEDMNTNVEVDTSGGDEFGDYKVEGNETLMLIAFKIYGDYSRWKELAGLNSGSRIFKGQKLKFKRPTSLFTWNPVGEPYLIKKGDTLGKISDQTYSTPKYWKSIWSNNKPIIKDPNLIFAGFTIYNPPADSLTKI